jgi:hypothetical protein
VFVQRNGTFLLVVEGARGPSNLDPGSNTMPTGSDRGDLQVLVSQAIGNGSPQVCDRGPAPTPFGGVPGTNPTDFAPGQTVTNAIQDMACRFSIQETSQVACTRDRQGDFGYLGTGSRKQYCYQVPVTAEFQSGDTVVAIQLRDANLNVGPKKEIVIRVEP